MKVLRPGREQRGWAGEFACTGNGNGGGGCGAKLLVEEGDIFDTFQGANYGGDSPERVQTFACGACGVWNDIPAGKAPHDVGLGRKAPPKPAPTPKGKK